MNATFADITPADIAAFRWQHPHLDRVLSSRVLATTANGTWIRQEVTAECFTFYEPSVGYVRFHVRRIKDAIAAGELDASMLDIDVTEDFIQHVRDNNGVEPANVERITPEHRDRPGLLVLWPDGNSTLIDGNHRLVRRWQDGLRTFRAAIVPIDNHLAPYMEKQQ